MDKLTGKPEIASIVIAGKRKLHYTYPDGSEMIEEYDASTNELQLRKIKHKREFGASDWVIEVGFEEEKFDPDTTTLALSSSNPIFLRKDSPSRFEWRIRNLKWPKDVYQLSIDHDKQQIVLRTTNKKYFKRINIPEMNSLELKLDET